jgi:F420-dependent oxidoreductase-like protein
MRIGVGVGDLGGRPAGLDDLVDQIRQAAAAKFASVWMPQVFGLDALTALAVAGNQVPGIELGTGVVPTYPRHPMMLGAQALTTQAACGGRLVLGVGLSHQIVIEGMFGYSFDKPARHMREYLTALRAVLHDGQVAFTGETIKANGTITVPGSTPVPVLVAALGPVMLRIAAELAEGTITWMTGPQTVTDHVVPTISAAAKAAGRADPRVVVGLPVCVTADVDQARERAARTFALYGQLPSYRAMLDREGAAGPGDVAILGDDKAVVAQLRRIADGGATDFMAAPFGSRDERSATVEVLSGLAADA